MNHGDMHHAGHAGHVDHAGMDHGDMKDMCSMSMLFTWNTDNLCIVFRQWHIRSTPSLVISLVAVVLLAMGYEALRALSRNYESSLSRRISTTPRDEQVTETTPFLPPGSSHEGITQRGHLIKAVLYGVQNFYAFMLMLVFMTYNGWVMIAVSLGAFLGYLVFGHTTSATKDNACH